MNSETKALLPTTARELIEKHATMSDNEIMWAMKRLPEHEKDLLIECPHFACGAGEGEECKGLRRREKRAGKLVHFGRRVKRLLKGIR